MSLYDGQGSRGLGGAEYDDGSSVLGGDGFVEDTEVGALAPNDLQVATTLDQASLADAPLEPNDLQVSTTLERTSFPLLPNDLQVSTTLGEVTSPLDPDGLAVSTTLGKTSLSLSPEDLQINVRLESISFRRPIDSGAQTEVEKAEGVAVTHVLEIHYEDAGVDKTLKLTTASQDITATLESESKTFTATPENVLGIGTIEVTPDMAAQGIELRLGGVDRTFIALVMDPDVHFRGRRVKLWRIYFDPSAGTVSAIVPDADRPWVYYLNDDIEFEEDWGGPGEPGSVKITTRLVSRLAVLQQPTPVRTTTDSHNDLLERAGVIGEDDPRDTVFKNLPGLIGRRFRWGDSYEDLE